MKLVDAKQMKAIDHEAIHRYDIPSILLMEHAAYSVFKSIKKEVKGKQVAIVCGAGNNAGDGFALARQLDLWGECVVHVICIADPKRFSEDARIYYNMLVNVGIPQVSIETFTKNKESYDYIIDALFGTGLTRAIEGKYLQIIQTINTCKGKIISLDVPSGIHADTGEVLGEAVKADVTYTFELIKKGLVYYPAYMYTGDLIVNEIGIPRELIEECETSQYLVTKEMVKSKLPKRYIRSHKGTYGKVAAIGGSMGMSGAISLCTNACVYAGAGTVTVVTDNKIGDVVATKVTEAMLSAIDYREIEKGDTSQLRKLLEPYTTFAVGPGLGRGEYAQKILGEVLEGQRPTVIDADALYVLKEELELLGKNQKNLIVTPHPAEFARLVNSPVEDVIKEPIKYALAFTQKYHELVLVLKLERTIIAKGGEIYVNATGNNGLASGGTGDVLTGIITGLLAQGSDRLDAAIAGVYIHGKCADLLAQRESVYSVRASEIYRYLGRVFKNIQR